MQVEAVRVVRWKMTPPEIALYSEKLKPRNVSEAVPTVTTEQQLADERSPTSKPSTRPILYWTRRAQERTVSQVLKVLSALQACSWKLTSLIGPSWSSKRTKALSRDDDCADE